jgi:hypothetical protein
MYAQPMGKVRIGIIDLENPDAGLKKCENLPDIAGFTQGIIRIPAEMIKF